MQIITQFLKMETLLDDSVDQTIELQIERGGTSLTVTLRVRFLLFIFILPVLNLLLNDIPTLFGENVLSSPKILKLIGGDPMFFI